MGKVVADAARRGDLLPPRDTTRGLGVALAADPLAWSFYPPRALHALLPYDLGFKLVLLLHGALAGLGAASLARRLGASPRERLLALTGAVLAGPVLSLTRHPNLLAAAAWAPFALAAFLHALDDGDRRQLARASLFVGLMLLAGGVELVLGLAPVLAIVAIAAGLPGRGLRVRVDFLLAPLAVLVLGGGLAAIQLVPTFRWIPETIRPGALSDAQAQEWSLPVFRLGGLLLRGLDPGERSRYGGEAFSPSIYLGFAVVALALRSVTTGDRRARAVALGCAVVLAMALGPAGKVLPLLRHLPVYDRFRFPEKLVLLVAVIAPALAAVGLHGLLLSRLACAWPRVANAVACALVLATGADLVLERERLLPTVPVAWYHEAPAAIALVGTGRVLVGPRVGQRGDGAREGPIAWHRETLLGGLAGLFGREDAGVYGPFAPARLAELMRETGAGPGFVELTAVDAVIAVASSEHAALGPGEPLAGTPLVVAHPRPGPRARLLARSRRVSHEQALIDANMPRERLLSFAFFEGDVPEVDSPGDAGTATVLERDAHRVRVKTTATGERFLVLSELFGRGVEASVDGAPTAVVPAYLALTGLRVPPGEHEVLLTWTVPGLGLGAAITALSAVMLLLLGVATPSRGRGPRGR
jgi:hypothetical protein